MRAIAFLLLLLGAPAFAQAPSAQREPPGQIDCSPRVPPGETAVRPPGFMPMEAVAAHLNASAPSLPLRDLRYASKAVRTVTFRISRPDIIKTPGEWRAAYMEAVLYPVRSTPGDISGRELIRGRVLPPSPENDTTEVTVLFPGIEGAWLPQRWEMALFVCVDPGYTADQLVPNSREMRAYARETLFFTSLRLSAVAGVLACLLVYLALGFAAAQMHARQYDELHRAAGGAAPPRWLYMLRPTVIAQDAFGHCSLSRFQVLLFTLTVTGVYAYVHARTGELPNLPESVLWLLGITLSGSTLARIAEKPVLDTPNRLWLFGTGVLDSAPREPRWSDLVTADGEIDVTRVQALVFSAFAAVALVVNGTGDLANFQIPTELNYLIGISQGVYVAGRALPQEAARRLNEEVRQLRDAETTLLADPADATAATAFETARAGLAPSLLDVFGDRVREGVLRALRPGERRAAA